LTSAVDAAVDGGDEVVEESADPTARVDGAPEDVTASWLARAGAFAVDLFFGLGVITTAALVWFSAPQQGWLWWSCTAVAAVSIVLIVVNRWWLPTVRGWSLGRAVTGIVVVTRTGGPASFARLAARDALHLLDTAALMIGWLWPLVDSRRRTFADLLARTEVHRSVPARDLRRPAAMMMIASVAVCAILAGLSYLTVYRPVQVADAARQQIADRGPQIVSDMLSYSAASLKDDFARAQSLVTDGYRPQLIAQQDTVQQAIKKVGPATNEYWVASSSVLGASPEHASMLLLMQGQRSAGQQPPRFISATVRATFDKSPDGQWRVADLVPLTKPQQPEPAK
jgi:Mce-associated membrane protein